MNSSSQVHLNNMQQPLTESRPSLLQQINMELKSSEQGPCTKEELASLVSEVEDLQNLMGIMPTDLERTMSTISLPNYPRALSPGWSKRSKGTNQKMTVNKKLMMNLPVENKDGQTKGRRFTSHKCLGSAWSNESENQMQTAAVIKPGTSLKCCNETQPLSRDGLDVQQAPQRDFQAQNGMHSSKESPLTLTLSSALYIMSTTLMKVSAVLELLKSSLGDQSLPRKLKQVASGPLPITLSSKRQCSSSPINMMNSDSMEIILKNSTQRSRSPFIQSYSAMTQQSGTKSGKGKIFYLPTENSLPNTTRPSSRQMELGLMEEIVKTKEVRGRMGNPEKNLMCVIDSVEKRDASLQRDSANTSTCVKNASRVDMEKWNAKLMRQCEELGKRPRYLRHNVYRDDDLSLRSCAE